MSIKNYFCRKCGTQRQDMYSPNPYGCSKGGKHSWQTFRRDGEVHYYRCRNCGTVKSELNHVPLIPNCSKGGNHSWEKIR